MPLELDNILLVLLNVLLKRCPTFCLDYELVASSAGKFNQCRLPIKVIQQAVVLYLYNSKITHLKTF